MILDEIKQALHGVDDKVMYGTAAAIGEKAPWNYIVYARKKTKFSGNLTSKSAVFQVAVVREEYIPDGVLESVVEAMCSIPGMRLSSDEDVRYVYDTKPKTQLTVEMLVATFSWAQKSGAR